MANMLVVDPRDAQGQQEPVYTGWQCPRCGCTQQWEDNLSYGCKRCDFVVVCNQ